MIGLSFFRFTKLATVLISSLMLCSLSSASQSLELSSDLAFEKIKQCSISQFNDCFLSTPQNYLNPSQSFLLKRTKKTKYSALLVHGLSDSPYFMKDIAKTLFEMGINVFALRLTGAGTHISDHHIITKEIWKTDFDYGMKIAERIGEKTIVVGFSTGGALALDAIASQSQEAAGLFLVGPAIRLSKNLLGNASCFAKSVKKLINKVCPGDNPVRYCEKAINSVCQVQTLAKGIQTKTLKFQGPLFAAFTDIDRTIDSSAGIEFLKRSEISQLEILLFQNSTATAKEKKLGEISGVRLNRIATEKPVPHGALPLASNAYLDMQNSSYHALDAFLRKFVSQLPR